MNFDKICKRDSSDTAEFLVHVRSMYGPKILPRHSSTPYQVKDSRSLILTNDHPFKYEKDLHDPGISRGCAPKSKYIYMIGREYSHMILPDHTSISL